MTGSFPSDSQSSHRISLIPFLLLLALNLFLFLPSMKGGFLWDDKYFISENQDLLSRGFLERLLVSPFGGAEGSDENNPGAGLNRQFYRPLTSLSYWLDFKVWRLNPAAFHLTNILLHLLNSILLFGLLLRFGFGQPASFSGAFLFSAFPVHFESVSWISGRTDLLSFFFAALSLLFFLRFLERKGGFRLLVSSLFYLAALLAKENVILLPLVFLFLLYRRRRAVKDVFLPLLPFGIAFVIWAALRFNALGRSEFLYSGRTLGDFLGTLGFYAWKTIFPFRLSVTINPSLVLGKPIFRVFGLFLIFVLAVSVFLAVKKRRSDGHLLMLVPAYFIFLLPSAAVIFSAATISLLGWRFLYLASAVFVSALAYVLFKKIKHRSISVAALVLFVVAYSAEVIPKNRLYGQEETNFWLGIKDLQREDLIARFNTGIKCLPVDEGKAVGILQGILGERGHPLYGFWKRRVHEELAIYFAFKKDFPGAEEHFQELMRMPSGLSLHASFNYAYYLAFAGRAPEGEVIILEKLRGNPRNHFVLTRAAKFYLVIKDYGKAAALYERDYEIFPSPQTQSLIRELNDLRQEAEKK